ncbi:putative subtilase-type serine protease precursor [Actinomadura rubteroloni]|uniref:Putative subtilase-type serine protease n=1 Tax=Actinomadura rubteroloni TaxID=1926885 RepID=A0A2P4UP13_9ACTN|nr:S8 family serine peptidase [Actinomadura rubteroloni]POM26784.1 putative subtilase-type serine protease precursor [Actinomadura rubteroloni]
MLCAVVPMVFGPVTASASPAPRPEEWWFTTWSVQPKVWPVSRGAGVTVAVVDSGANGRLPELADRLLPGWDATGNGTDGRTDVDIEKDMFDKGGFGHGSGMAALIVANGSGTGMLGLAPDTKVLPVVARVSIDYAKGITWSADHGAKVINVSAAWRRGPDGNPCSPDLQRAIDHALERDVVVVAGSGNSPEERFMEPGGCPGVLTVGAVDGDLKPWANTTRQPSVDVAAPGVHIGTLDRKGKMIRASGTSASTALTSAVVALVRAKFPSMSAREVVQRIVATAKDVGPSGKDEQTGYGLVMPYRALTADVPKNAANPVYAEWDRHHGQAPPVKQAARPVGDDGTSAVLSAKALALTGLGIAVLLAIVGTAVVVVARSRRQARAR